MFFRYITNIDLKKETLEYLRKYRSYLVKRERAQRGFENSIRRRILSDYNLNYGTKVRVRYKGNLIEGVIVGYPKDSRDRFCLESPQLDVIKKEYRNQATGKRYIAKRKYFPFSAIDLPKNATSEFKNESKGFKFDSFHFDFKYASDSFQQSLKETIITKEDVDKAIKIVSPMKISRYVHSPETRYSNCQQAIKDGMTWLDPITFLYRGEEVMGIVGHDPSIGSDYIKVFSEFVDSGFFCKYVHKQFFISCFRSQSFGLKLAREIRNKMKEYIKPEEEPFEYMLPPKLRWMLNDSRLLPTLIGEEPQADDEDEFYIDPDYDED